MKKSTINKALALCLVAIFCTITASCTKGGINDELDGQWRIISIENLADGEITEPQNLFINIYLHTVNLTEGRIVTTGIMTYTSPRIYFEFPYNTDNTSLNRWGIYNWQTTFTIEHLSSKSLIMTSDAARISLKKF